MSSNMDPVAALTKYFSHSSFCNCVDKMFSPKCYIQALDFIQQCTKVIWYCGYSNGNIGFVGACEDI